MLLKSKLFPLNFEQNLSPEQNSSCTGEIFCIDVKPYRQRNGDHIGIETENLCLVHGVGGTIIRFACFLIYWSRSMIV